MATKETMDTIEKVVDVVEDTAETLERIPKVHLNGTTKKQQLVILGVTAVVSALAGGAAAWYIADKRLRLKYEEIAQKEIEDAQAFYTIQKNKRFQTPEEAVRELHGDADSVVVEAAEAMVRYSGDDEPEVSANPAFENEVDKTATARIKEGQELAETIKESADRVINVFTDSLPSYDEEEEARNRVDGRPYVVSEEMALTKGSDALDYDDAQLTWFAGDKVLVDARDEVIHDVDNVVGRENLERFGAGTDDPLLVYIRNDRLETDFEVKKSGGKYTVEVLNLEEYEEEPAVLRHSDRGRHPGKFRLRE